jgi:UDP-glucose:(heptosyl)LPS alpha-1,3-glucosyltransferase
VKIALSLEHFDPRRGGLETWTWQFAHRLAEAGHEVHVVACGFSGRDTAPPLHLHQAPPSPSPLRRAEALEQSLRSLAPDVIHDMGAGWHADIFHPHGGSSAAFREHNLMRIPRWRQFRLWQEKRYREQRRLEKCQHARAEALVVAVSRMVEGHLQKFNSLPPDRIRLIYNGVDGARFTPPEPEVRAAARQALGCGTDEVLFLMVAHNLRLKNAETAIHALGRLVREGKPARLVVVGGRKPAPFQRLAEKLGLSERVTFHDPVEDIRPFYAAADALLHPTWYDPCSLVALEALACGLPLVTTRYNGVSELMTDGAEGFLLGHPADAESLATLMIRLLDPCLRACQAAAARQLALTHTFDHQVNRFLELYAEIRPHRSKP